MLIFKIAWRNIQRHKGKSIVIGTILFLGALIMTAGNATTIGMERGLEQNIVQRMTGHIMLASSEENRDDVLFTPMGKPIKLLKDYEKIREILKNQEYIQDFLPMTRGGAILADVPNPYPMFLLGVNFDDYQRVFLNNISAKEGALLKNGDHGILMNDIGRDRLYKMLGTWVVPEGQKIVPENLSPEANEDAAKSLSVWARMRQALSPQAKEDAAIANLETRDRLVLMGFGTENSSNITVPVKAVYRAQALNAVWDEISILDIESFRECFGYYKAKDLVQELPPEQKKLMESSETDFFSDDIFSTGETSLNVAAAESKIAGGTGQAFSKIDYDSAAYNIVSIKLKPGVSIDDGIARINKTIKENNLPVKAVTWRQAVGMTAQMIGVLEGALSAFVFILFFVAIIIIMNTLAMAAMERTEELGMMRAVGARKMFISKMFFAETFILSFFSGGIGIFFGVILTWIVRALNIGTGGSDLLNLFFGGDTFQPTLGFNGLVTGVFNLAIVMVLSVIYPIFVARRITPLDAVNKQ
jgi:putative ABC transport system permease protein